MKPATVKGTKEVLSSAYIASKYLFLFGLAFVTFEEVRPGGIMLSDYFFLLSVIFLPKARLKEIGGSGVLLASGTLLTGAVLSVYFSGGWGIGAGNLLRLGLLFAIIAPLSLCHSKDIYRCFLFLAGGIFLNCFITVLQASIFPGIVDAFPSTRRNQTSPSRVAIKASLSIQSHLVWQQHLVYCSQWESTQSRKRSSCGGH